MSITLPGMTRVAGIALGAALALAHYAAAAQGAWKPERPVELIVTCQPGCGPDIAARTIQKIWQDHRIVETSAVVVNKPGGGGSVAYGYLKQKPGDAHAMVLSGAGAVVNSIIGRGVGHRDITSLAMMAAEYVAIAVKADSPIESGRQLIDILKKDPGAVSFGIANSLGNANHQAIALALKSQGIHPGKARNVVFQSGANAMTALLGGHVQVVPASVGLWVNPVKAGQVKLIAVSAPRRLAGEMATVPTWREQGVDAVVSVWRMMTAPPGLTPAQLTYWQQALRKTTETPEWKRDLQRNYQSDEFVAGPEFERAIGELHAQLKGLLTDLELAKGDSR
ncbi:MAG: tripartite tricarboxylate transporter substrate binding protein [Betaproteobacteria bacterium]